ncbi:hypothetical protein SOM61_08445 [Massilia sp. CFBP9012]|uniref:hypothetical protein n=1 Tax=Massilia sp. CFBP9012 TaxID=3096531 RepID=UPI002A6B58EC|nr:hypothetical protein [Massilia sp. CFBP9012]MDY0974989.1 hypothetical protein [Massilia sp. CFBP9012]
MGFLKDLVGIAAPIAGTIIGGPVGGAIGGALGGLASGSGQPKSHTTTQQQQLDPRLEQMLFGNGGDNKGLLSQYQGFMNQPRSDAATGFANANAQYLNNNGAADLAATRGAAYQAMQGNPAPMTHAAGSAGATASLPAYAVGEKVNAPSQNNIDLSGSYNSLINGAPGANPYLTGSIQKGINQSSNAFGNMVTDAKSATNDVLGSIRGNSVLAGQFGGSRQGIAEGKAIDSMNTNLARAASQFGQNNTDAAVAAQAGAYDADRNRQLAATQGLGAQQYGVAQQEASYAQQAQMQNVQNSFDASKTNASMAQQNNQFNAGLGHQTNLANQQSQLATNGQNTSAGLAGAGLLSGLLGNASNQVNANDNWGLGRAQGVNSLLAPYLGANSSSSSSQPVYNNQGGNALGGAMLGGQLAGLFGGGSGGTTGTLGSLFGGGGWGTSGSYF